MPWHMPKLTQRELGSLIDDAEQLAGPKPKDGAAALIARAAEKA